MTSDILLGDTPDGVEGPDMLHLIVAIGAEEGLMQPRIYHVERREDNSWQVIREGFKRPHMTLKTKREAVTLAKRFAKTGSAGAQVIVHDGPNTEHFFCYGITEAEEAPAGEVSGR